MIAGDFETIRIDYITIYDTFTIARTLRVGDTIHHLT